jgi:hypothetical protein
VLRNYVQVPKSRYSENVLSAYSAKRFLVWDLVTGGLFLPIASLRLLRVVSEWRKVGSLLSAVPVSPAKGGVVAEGHASGLVGGGCGKSPARELLLANG